ncbi:protein of unknown function [Psychroflexus halocasei]|uniref:DUF4153 domain-containing protein n=2 Tax=Psychroflexus halocasei TaxID=908615 RepID=A0A1H3Y726_9FLAO|nr:protein of unknown function [Psychroflexus halocasei]
MKYLNELPTRTKAAFMRFPVTIIWSIVGSVYVTWLIGLDTRIFNEFTSLIFTLILGVSWLIGTQFLIESLRIYKYSWLLKLGVIGLLIIYYFSFNEEDFDDNPIQITRWFLLFLAGHIFVFFAPFLKEWNKIDYWNYLQQIVISITRAALFTFVIFGGLALAILAVDNLFNVHINDNVYGQLYVICLGIINTFIYLADFPKKIHNTQKLAYSKALDVFLKFILIPILVIYLIIVYAYTFQILILWELPQGWVSYLISILAIIGLIIQIIIEPLRQTHPNILIRKFYPYFYILLFPLLILLFVAIYTRIADYNFTENRYFLVVLAFWIFGISLYMIFSNKKKLKIIPISLFILIILASYGPWSAFNVSINAQVKELEEMINKIKSNSDEFITVEEDSQFRNITRYLKKRNRLNELDASLGFKTSYLQNSYTAGNQLLDSLYGSDRDMSSRTAIENKYYHYNQLNYKHQFNLDVKDYQTMVEIALNQNESHRYQISHQPNSLTINDQDEKILEVDIDSLLLESLKKYPNFKDIPQEELNYTFKNTKGTFSLILKNFRFHKTNKTSLNFIHLSGYLLVNENIE